MTQNSPAGQGDQSIRQVVTIIEDLYLYVPDRILWALRSILLQNGDLYILTQIMWLFKFYFFC